MGCFKKKYEGNRHLSAFFHLHAQVFIIGGETRRFDGLKSSLVLVSASA